MDLSVSEAAERLGLDDSRVRQMLRSNILDGHQVGRAWLVSADSVAQLESRVRPAGRPLAPNRAWGLLDILDGRSAPWLRPVARSQARHQIERLAGAGPDQWRAALRARGDRFGVDGHRSAISRLLQAPGHLDAGGQKAAEAGINIVVLDPVPEIYLPAGDWDRLYRQLHLRPKPPGAWPMAVVRVPKGLWPFEGRDRVGAAVLAADLLDSSEPRALKGGADMLNRLARAATRR